MSRPELRGLALHFDCFSGLAGDMTLGALIDLGVPVEVIQGELKKLPLTGYRLWQERVKRGALVGTKAHVDIENANVHDHEHVHDHAHDHAHAHAHVRDDVHAHAHEHPHVHWRQIREMLVGHLSGTVLERTLAIFERIAVVEAKLHGVSVEEVAFHEVGAVDSIVDIVGAAAGLAWLQPSRVSSRPVPLGGGSVSTAHGRLPVPAPATLELLTGVPVEAGTDAQGELTTPTGAAILAASVNDWGPMPPIEVAAVGWGAGDRELPDRPNLVRLIAGRPSTDLRRDNSECVVVEANIDDMNPELVEPLFDALFAAGALDVWLQPITMKRGRPALLVSALCTPARKDEVANTLFTESTTIGVRHRTVARTVLPRELVEVDTPYGRVPVKVASAAGSVDAPPLNVAPEFKACQKLAAERGVPTKLVYQAALAAFYRR
jgi:uncharacterized protein (TIGR00299 family) protein